MYIYIERERDRIVVVVCSAVICGAWHSGKVEAAASPTTIPCVVSLCELHVRIIIIIIIIIIMIIMIILIISSSSIIIIIITIIIQNKW